MERLDFFSHRQISTNAYLVTENYGISARFSVGVVVGLEQIAVIDAGLGLSGSLRKYIEGFAGTEKPFLCYCTSGKAEHIGAAAQFDTAYVSSLDAALPAHNWAGALPDAIVRYGTAIRPESGAPAFQELTPGFIAIGRQHISPRPMPGNTPGSFVLINGEEKLCFLGDAVGPEVTVLPYLDRAGMNGYAEQLTMLTEERGGELRFYCGRSAEPLSAGYLLRVAAACRAIAEGKTSGDLPAAEAGRRMHIAENAAVVYDAAKCE